MAPKKKPIPTLDNLSFLVAIILLAYTLTHFVSIPSLDLELRLIGIYLPLTINFSLIVSFLVAGLATSGTVWILQEHPEIHSGDSTVDHWLLPGLTALVLMLVIEQFPFGLIWWVAAFLGGFLLMLVLLAEYIAVDPENDYYHLAEMGITTLSIAFFFILSIALHAEEIRLLIRVPLIGLAAGLVFLRILHVRTRGSWVLVPALVASIVIGQLSAAFHYWPMNSISFGITLLGPLYGLIEFGEQHSKNTSPPPPQAYLFPGFLVILSWIIALLI
ncbi:MAG: hypothetical protein KGY39_00235 [Anaerolineales bacterium]|nr:hypothetical protein [Anaerolineales bacterium]